MPIASPGISNAFMPSATTRSSSGSMAWMRASIAGSAARAVMRLRLANAMALRIEALAHTAQRAGAVVAGSDEITMEGWTPWARPRASHSTNAARALQGPSTRSRTLEHRTTEIVANGRRANQPVAPTRRLAQSIRRPAPSRRSRRCPRAPPSSIPRGRCRSARSARLGARQRTLQ